MAGEYAVPLLLAALILLAIASWRVVHPPLALAFTAVIGLCSAGYVLLSLIPRILAATDPADVAAVPIEAAARDARPDRMAIQVYRGPELLGECALASPGTAAAPAPEPLRLARAASGGGFQVWSGATLLGDLPETSLAALGLGPTPAAPPPEPEEPAEPETPIRAATGPPQFFLTGKVTVGGTAWLGQLPPAGPVSVQFLRLNERGLAVVKVNAPDLGPAEPPTLELNNKSALTQSFQGMHFDVAIREASFVANPPWAAFAVMARP